MEAEMDAESRGRIEDAVLSIIKKKSSDIDEMSEQEIRALAEERLGLDLSLPDRLKIFRKELHNDGELLFCNLSNNRKVTLQEFRGRKLVSIREYYEKDGKQLPSAKEHSRQ